MYRILHLLAIPSCDSCWVLRHGGLKREVNQWRVEVQSIRLRNIQSKRHAHLLGLHLYPCRLQGLVDTLPWPFRDGFRESLHTLWIRMFLLETTKLRLEFQLAHHSDCSFDPVLFEPA